MGKPAYYNEFDPYVAQWLRNLIARNLIPRGDVDERSIVDVRPSDLAGYAQCHFFAGIGGWALAARLAGWPDDRELWTGSCPCQPFSAAGKQKGQADERHLWPEYLRLIRACWPAFVVGEQVAAAVGLNWLDGVLADLEDIGYAGRAVVLPACAVDSPQPRDRLWFVGDGYGAVADRSGVGSPARNTGPEPGEERNARIFDDHGGENRGDVIVGHAGKQLVDLGIVCGGTERSREAPPQRPLDYQHASSGNRSRGGFWSDYQWIVGPDGKARRIKPGLRLLADGLSGRVGRLRAYGNAIVPQEGAVILQALLDCAP
jgi:DNA (cytosine-5)-methyltransferase 1